MKKRFGIIRYKPNVRQVTFKYETAERRDHWALVYAQRDNHRVGCEEYVNTPGVGWEWRLTGAVEPV